MLTFAVSFTALGQADLQTPAAPPAPAIAQNFAAAGISFAPGASPAIAGTALYSRLISATSRTYSFTLLDAVPTTTKPYSVSTQTATGIAQRLFTMPLFRKRVDIYATGAAGPSWAGSNTGWAWNAGGLASIPIGANRIMPNLRVNKSSVNNHSDYQLMGGVLYGWGWN